MGGMCKCTVRRRRAPSYCRVPYATYDCLTRSATCAATCSFVVRCNFKRLRIFSTAAVPVLKQGNGESRAMTSTRANIFDECFCKAEKPQHSNTTKSANPSLCQPPMASTCSAVSLNGTRSSENEPPGAVPNKEAEINVDDVALVVQQNIAVVPVLQSEQVGDERVGGHGPAWCVLAEGVASTA